MIFLIRQGKVAGRKLIPELREVVFFQAHGRALGPEEVLGELVGDEADGEAVAVTGAAARGRTLPHPELIAVLLAAQLKLTRVLHLRLMISLLMVIDADDAVYLITSHIRIQELEPGFLALVCWSRYFGQGRAQEEQGSKADHGKHPPGHVFREG